MICNYKSLKIENFYVPEAKHRNVGDDWKKEEHNIDEENQGLQNPE